MTKKDFQLIADTIASFEVDEAITYSMAERFADRLAETNPRFNRDRFIKACLR